jgi:hypothetical protein
MDFSDLLETKSKAAEIGGQQLLGMFEVGKVVPSGNLT